MGLQAALEAAAAQREGATKALARAEAALPGLRREVAELSTAAAAAIRQCRYSAHFQPILRSGLAWRSTAIYKLAQTFLFSVPL